MLLDLMMPGMSGTELMLHLREIGMHIPTIVISADTEAPRRMRGQRTEGILIKPFSLASLLPIIERQVDRGRTREAGKTP
jgi:DNA-binding response OmpR family regulator